MVKLAIEGLDGILLIFDKCRQHFFVLFNFFQENLVDLADNVTATVSPVMILISFLVEQHVQLVRSRKIVRLFECLASLLLSFPPLGSIILAFWIVTLEIVLEHITGVSVVVEQ